MKRIATGGPLNILNEKFKCNAPRNTVPIMALVNEHQDVTSARGLEQLIAAHFHSQCPCGIRSNGTVATFANALYKAQFKDEAWMAKNGEHSEQQCYDFHYQLFCVGPVRGRQFETQSKLQLMAALYERAPEVRWVVRDATPREDADMAVDYVIGDAHAGSWQMGVQVKPVSVLSRGYVVEENKRKHTLFPGSVIWHVYGDDGRFTDTQRLTGRIATERARAIKAGQTPCRSLDSRELRLFL